MDFDNGGIIIDMDIEKIEELKKKWKNVNKISSKMLDVSKVSFWISLLSPFDFDGPLIELMAGVISLVSLYLVKLSDKKIIEIEENLNNRKR